MKPPRAALASTLIASLSLATSATPAGNGQRVQASELRRFLTYLASDELEGRATFTEGLGLAAAYVAEQLRAMGVKPGGDDGSYFQRVRVIGVKSANRSTLTLEVDGRSRTFKEGESGISFPRNVGGKRRLVLDQVEFVGYGLDAPGLKHLDYAGKDVRGKAVVWLGAAGPTSVDGTYRRLLSGRHRYATEQMQAAASLGPELPRFRPGQQQADPRAEAEAAPAAPASPTPAPTATPATPAGQGGFGRAPLPTPDFTTAQRLDKPIPPNVTARDELFEFLFSAAPQKYAELKEAAAKRAPLPSFRLADVKLTFDLDADYEVVRTQFTRNVVGILPGSDAGKRDSYVAFGAHYDHVGYAEGEVTTGPNGPRRLGAPGRVKDKTLDDRFWNGADDDGSGSATLLGIAQAAAAGPRPKRSLVFIWHTGEERGLWGSRYFADYPGIAPEKIAAQLNMDMVGRNREDKPEESNTVYLVGSDRISTELHNLSEETNARLPRPLKLDYEMNDPSDLEQVYYRSDHFSYAAYGIPIIFYTTGLHPDYHVNTDSVEKIEFEKMARIGQLVLETGLRVANLEHPPARDNKGARAGKGFAGKLAAR